jgi:hypothetical protein
MRLKDMLLGRAFQAPLAAVHARRTNCGATGRRCAGIHPAHSTASGNTGGRAEPILPPPPAIAGCPPSLPSSFPLLCAVAQSSQPSNDPIASPLPPSASSPPLAQVEDLPMESTMLSDALDTAQKRVEAYFFDIRK